MYGFDTERGNTIERMVAFRVKKFFYSAYVMVFNDYYPLSITKEIRTTNKCCPYLNSDFGAFMLAAVPSRPPKDGWMDSNCRSSLMSVRCILPLPCRRHVGQTYGCCLHQRFRAPNVQGIAVPVLRRPIAGKPTYLAGFRLS